MNRISIAYDIVTAVRRQLPRTLADQLTVAVISDPFHLRTTVRFECGGRHWDCKLEPQRCEDGRIIAARVPDSFLARLSVECL